MITINKNRVNKLNPIATRVVKESKIKTKNGDVNLIGDDNALSKTYGGYVSSFSANCIKLTPLSTAIIYDQNDQTDSDSGSKEDKSLINKWIVKVLKAENTHLSDEP